jgi:cytolysin-activating lysine-acyltransferase
VDVAEKRTAYYAKMGALCLLHSSLAADDTARGINVALYFANPMMLDQSKFYVNDAGELTGFVSWAFVTQEVLDRCSDTGCYDMHISEWCEGPLVLIIDLIAPPGQASVIKRDLLRNIFQGENILLSARVR